VAAWHEDYAVFEVPRRALVLAVEEALRDIGAGAVRWNRAETDVTAVVRPRLLSLGEWVRIRIEAETGEVRVMSRSLFPLMFVDFGRNRGNVRRLLDSITSWLEAFDDEGVLDDELRRKGEA
jgi:hypothetical protein